MSDRVFAGIGVAGGLFTSFVGVSHLWPLVTPSPAASSMLHVLTAWAMLPLGLLLAIRDAHGAGMVSAHSILGSRFDAALALVETKAHFIIFLIWAGLACASFGGMYGYIACLACLARAGTLLDVVRKGIDMLREELQNRNIHVPGFTEKRDEPPKET